MLCMRARLRLFFEANCAGYTLDLKLEGIRLYNGSIMKIKQGKVFDMSWINATEGCRVHLGMENIIGVAQEK